MTTLIALKGKDFIVLASDSQVSEGNNRLCFPYEKIVQVDFCLVGGAGSVGYTQRILATAIKDIKLSKVLNEELDFSIDYVSLINKLADLNFSLPLEHKHWTSFSFLVGGLDNLNQPVICSIGEDGSLIEIPTYYATGSGANVSLGIIGKFYKDNLTKEESENLVHEALLQSCKNDLFTNNDPLIYTLFKEGKVWKINKKKVILSKK